MDRVTVFRFGLDGDESDSGFAPRAATEERIRQIMDATLVVETALVVDTHCVDGQGFLIDGHFPSAPA